MQVKPEPVWGALGGVRLWSRAAVNGKASHRQTPTSCAHPCKREGLTVGILLTGQASDPPSVQDCTSSRARSSYMSSSQAKSD